MSRLKVTHVIYSLRVGGMENGLVNLIDSTSTEFEHSIVCLKDYDDFRHRIQTDDIKIYALGKKPGKDLGCMFRVASLLRRIRPDILHTRNLGTLDLPPVGRLAGVPVSIHGEHGWDMVDLDGQVKRYRLLRRFVSPFVTKFTTVSEHLRNWLVTNVGIRRDKICHITNGVDVENFRSNGPINAELRGFRELARDDVIVGTIGRLQPVKNQALLLRAAARLHHSLPRTEQPFSVWIVGDGPERRKLEALASELGIQHLTRFLGERKDVASILRCMDVFVLPSLNEGISNTLLEAMATGLPCVATRVGGNSELVVDGASGFLTKPGEPEEITNALARYINDRQLRAEHGNSACTRAVSEFSLATMVSRYVNLYRTSTSFNSSAGL